jgi:ribosomal protein S18 acetylase RimI-like enzyme
MEDHHCQSNSLRLATTFSDPQIWEERNNDSAVYIHRIATNPEFRGQNLVGHILEWAKKFALENKKRFIRMDTVGENPGLINYYTKFGFDFLGLSKLQNTGGLPAHYDNATVSLFQFEL